MKRLQEFHLKRSLKHLFAPLLQNNYQQRKIFGLMIVILNILTDILLYYIGYCSHFNIMCEEYIRFNCNVSSYKLSFTIGNALVGIIKIQKIITHYKHNRYWLYSHGNINSTTCYHVHFWYHHINKCDFVDKLSICCAKLHNISMI